MQRDDNLRSGMTPEEGDRAAKIRLGSIESVLQDLRYALRGMGRSPGFTAVAVMTLAVAIGINAAVFTIAKGMPYSLPLRIAAMTRGLRCPCITATTHNGFSSGA